MQLTIHHETHYDYDSEVASSTQYLRLVPPDSPYQRIVSWTVHTPDQTFASRDAFGNHIDVLTIDHPHHAIHVVAEGVVEITRNDNTLEIDNLPVPWFLRTTPLTTADAALKVFSQSFEHAIQTHTQRELTAMMHAVLHAMPYQRGMTSTSTPAAEAFAQASGVCQDHTHVFITLCRLLGLPARYVSGYLYTHDDDHVATHAWAEVWMGEGWQGFDVSNGIYPGDTHLRLAVGIDYLDACPIRGVRRGGGMERMHTHARVTAVDLSPVAVDSWAQIQGQ